MSEWQPIETAPAQGTFLVWNGHNVEMVMAYDDALLSSSGFFIHTHPEELGPEHFDATGTLVEDFPAYEIKGATHWMPLPNNPTPNPTKGMAGHK